MQSVLNVAHSVYRIVFRGGSPQRVQYSDRRLVSAVLGCTGLACATQLLFFSSSIVETGLGLFTMLTGTYLFAAFLTRRTPRARLRQTLLAIFLILGAVQIPLIMAVPLAELAAWVRPAIAAGVALAVLLGLRNSLRFALGSSAAIAWAYTLVYVLALGVFYATMRYLLGIVFA